MAFTTAEVNTWFQTIDGLPATTAGIPANLATAYVAELNSVPPTASEPQIQAQLENQTAPPPNNVATDTFYRTSVAQFVLREFQAAWGVVPNTTQFDAWVARVIANPASVETGGGMSQALAGTQQFLNTYGLQPGQLATTGFINQLLVNLGLNPATHPGAFLNVGQPVATVLQNFVTSQPVIASLNTPIVNFQNLLLAGGTFPTGSILTVGPGGALNLTTGVDTPTTGFSTGNGATATAAGATFSALPGTNVLGASNTLNAGDDLVATGAALGDSTLNYTAVASANGNPPVAVGVTMNGVSTAVITNLHAAVAGFSGTITGLTTATEGAGSVGNVRFGTAANALNTALTTVNVNAGHELTAFMTAAALAAAPTATVNVNGGVVGAGADLEVATGNLGYASLTVNSAGPGGTTTNALALDTNATNTATITATGAEFLTLTGNALDIHNLHTFTGAGATPDTGGLNVTFTNDDALGNVTATGGSGVNTFTFDDTLAGLASFTTLSTVNGGTGTTNTLGIEADTGAILLTGVGPNITHIATIEHTTDAAGQTGALTADLSLMTLSSATTFDLAGDYNALVTVNNITAAQTVEFSGTSAPQPGPTDNLTLVHAAPATGQVFNFEMSQNAPTPPGGTLDLGQLTVLLVAPVTSQQVNFLSTGNATNNEINNVSLVDANITITGATHYQLGDSGPDGYVFQTPTASGVIDASAATGGGEVWLGNTALNSPFATQTFIAGTGTNIAHIFNPGGDLVDFSKGGTDTVEFALGTQPGAADLLTNPMHFFNQVVGFVGATDSINFSVGGNPIDYTDTAAPVLGTDPTLVSNFTGVSQNLSIPGNHFNFIDFTSTTGNFTGETPQAAFVSAIGGAAITTAGGTSLLSFYDAATHQAVLATTTGSISNASAINVVGLIGESAADYAHIATNLHFVA
jgi:hypothetical protein